MCLRMAVTAPGITAAQAGWGRLHIHATVAAEAANPDVDNLGHAEYVMCVMAAERVLVFCFGVFRTVVCAQSEAGAMSQVMRMDSKRRPEGGGEIVRALIPSEEGRTRRYMAVYISTWSYSQPS